MAVIDRVTTNKAVDHMSSTLHGVDIDWGLVIGPAVDAAKKALTKEIWEWIDEDPNRTVFKIKIDTKVWFVPVKINWKVKAKDAIPLIQLIFGERP
jgi:hypothetical protein